MLSAPNKLRIRLQCPQVNGALQYTVFRSSESCWVVGGGGSGHTHLKKLNELDKLEHSCFHYECYGAVDICDELRRTGAFDHGYY